MRSCILLLVSAALAFSADIELSLTNGRTVRGELVSETGAVITLRSRFPARGVVKEVESIYAKADILKRKELPSAAEQYAERKTRTPDTVPEQCTLAQWAYENCLREQARTHALRVIELDPENAWGRRILDNCGYMEVSGKWVDENEYLKANNLVRVDGEVMAAGLAEARRTYARAHMVYDLAKRKLADTRETATNKAGSSAAAEGKAKEATAQMEAAAKAIESATEALAKAKEGPTRTADERSARQTAIDAATKVFTEARDKQREAKRTADSAKQTGISDKSAADRAKAAIPDLEAALAKAEAELKAAAAKLPADDPLLTKPEKPAEAPADAKPAVETPDQPVEPEKPKVRRLRSGGAD